MSVALAPLLGVLLLAMSVLLTPAAARVFYEQCPPGSYVVGFTGNVGAWIDSMTFACAPWDAAGGQLGIPSVLKEKTVGDSKGGDPQGGHCPQGSVVGPRLNYLTAWKPLALHSIRFDCSPAGKDGQIIPGRFGSFSTITAPENVLPSLRMDIDCPAGERLIGIKGLSEQFIDRLEGICGPAPALAPAPPVGGTNTLPTRPLSQTLVCRGGGSMELSPGPGQADFRIHYQRAAAAASAQAPGPGQCAWASRPVNLYEQQTLHFVADGTSKSEDLKNATKQGGTFELRAFADNSKGWLEITSIKSVQLPPAGPSPPAQPPPSTPPAPTETACGLPGGTAVVTIANPRLTTLNVRTAPGGAVLGTIPEGTQVSVVGPCGPAGSAGIAAPSPQQTTPAGWCQIDKPVSGCVSAEFLQLGATGATGAAGILPSPTSGFAGNWTSLVDKVAHQITLQQVGEQVTGTFAGADGSHGQISGKAKGGVLEFSWFQTDGSLGSGKFTLSKDARSFIGSYSYGRKPNLVTGSWNGSRP